MAKENIAAVATYDTVITKEAEELIGTEAAIENIVVVAAINRVITNAAVDSINAVFTS